MILIERNHPIPSPDYDSDPDLNRIGYQQLGTVEDQLVMRVCHETLWGGCFGRPSLLQTIVV
jgi:hypothetical protein